MKREVVQVSEMARTTEYSFHSAPSHADQTAFAEDFIQDQVEAVRGAAEAN